MSLEDDCISILLLTRKNLTNPIDIKKECLLVHAKDVIKNCQKAHSLCLREDCPYKDGTFPSGHKRFDYI